MDDVVVFYLAYAPYGVEPVERFLRSYRSNRAGIEHKFVVLCKAFPSTQLPPLFEAALHEQPHQRLVVPDCGFDIGSYVYAARQTRARSLVFLNTQSEILAEDWLRKLMQAFANKDVGLAGATASNESHFSAHLRSLRSPRTAARVLLKPAAALQLISAGVHFRGFPNFHVRSNAFAITKDLLLSLKLPTEIDKFAAYQIESGRNSITQHVVRRGLRAVVVGKDGRVYSAPEIPASRTFRSGAQENLLVADNRTRQYAEGNEATRRMLATLAWGSAAVI